MSGTNMDAAKLGCGQQKLGGPHGQANTLQMGCSKPNFP